MQSEFVIDVRLWGSFSVSRADKRRTITLSTLGIYPYR